MFLIYFNYDVLIKLICNHQMFLTAEILSVVKRNPLFLDEIEWKNNGFLFTTSNIIKLYG